MTDIQQFVQILETEKGISIQLNWGILNTELDCTLQGEREGGALQPSPKDFGMTSQHVFRCELQNHEHIKFSLFRLTIVSVAQCPLGAK